VDVLFPRSDFSKYAEVPIPAFDVKVLTNR
jgi:hypothetical protein